MTDRAATLYRMVLPEHECPFGVRARQLLDDAGWTINEYILVTRDEVEAFKLEYQVATTPQIFINDERVGGSEELAAFLEERGA